MKTNKTLVNSIALFCLFFLGLHFSTAQEAAKQQQALVSSTTWNGSSWSNGLPNAQTKALFASNFISDQTLVAESVEVLPSVRVSFEPGTNLIVTNEVNVSPLGNLTFKANANLSQKNPNIVNSTLISFTRTTPPITKFDYVYWSSPVQGQSVMALSMDTLPDKYLEFIPPATWHSVDPSTIMAAGKGYSIRGPQPFLFLTPFDGNFSGMANNGDITTPIGVGSNLIGNPYPEALSADCFILDPDNQATTGGTLFFWTHNIPLNWSSGTVGVGTANYNVNDYAVYNLLGGVGTGAYLTINGNVVINRPNGYVATG